MKVTKEQVFGVIRHGLTFVGAILLLRGQVDQQQWLELSGGIITVASIVWSIFEKKPKA